MLGARKLGAWSLRAGIDAYAKGHHAKALRYWLFASRADSQDANLYIGELYERGRASSPVPSTRPPGIAAPP